MWIFSFHHLSMTILLVLFYNSTDGWWVISFVMLMQATPLHPKAVFGIIKMTQSIGNTTGIAISNHTTTLGISTSKITAVLLNKISKLRNCNPLLACIISWSLLSKVPIKNVVCGWFLCFVLSAMSQLCHMCTLLYGIWTRTTKERTHTTIKRKR